MKKPSFFILCRETIDVYTMEMQKLAVSLLGFMGMATGTEFGEFSEVCKDGVLQLRMNYYPPCSQPEQVIGSSPHTDFTSITLLLEFDDTPGLQIRKDGHWATVKPVPGAVDVIIGNVIEVTKQISQAHAYKPHMKNDREQELCEMSFTFIISLEGRIMLRLHFDLL